MKPLQDRGFSNLTNRPTLNSRKYGDKEAYNMAVKYRERAIFELGVVGGN